MGQHYLDDFGRGQRVELKGGEKGTVLEIRAGRVIVQVDDYACSNSFEPGELTIIKP